MKHLKLIFILLLVLFCFLFLSSTERISDQGKDKKDIKIIVETDHETLFDFDFINDLDWELLEELGSNLAGLDHRIQELVDGAYQTIVPGLECFKALENIELQQELETFFDDFQLDDFKIDFDWEWGFFEDDIQ
jgi:hypothetical protein